MRVVLQRVREGSVEVEGKLVGQIGRGLVLLIGATIGDSEKEVVYLADKCANLRIFEDAEGKMNLSLLDIGGEVLTISQFTLYGDTRKGRRPSFTQAMEPVQAEKLYQKFIGYLKEKGLKVEQGIFGAKMLVEIFNDGPVTFVLDSKEKMSKIGRGSRNNGISRSPTMPAPTKDDPEGSH
ncbi:MAG TPA: D-aminoacyl-tRNA deacylase [Terriglobales bacterium]|nr:D-aminoacyl-tRNA deacylase [Terriglobales bacterium]